MYCERLKFESLQADMLPRCRLNAHFLSKIFFFILAGPRGSAWFEALIFQRNCHLADPVLVLGSERSFLRNLNHT